MWNAGGDCCGSSELWCVEGANPLAVSFVILFTTGIPCRCAVPHTILYLYFRPDDDRLTVETCRL